MNTWVTYRNGNYDVLLNTKTGSKIRRNNLNNLTPSRPESMDIKICNRCNMMCPQCHEHSTPDGLCGDIMNAKFIDTLLPYTELAIGGGNPLEHPDLEKFLYKCKELKLIPSMTVHQKHFMENLDFFRMLKQNELIYGIGVSITTVTPKLISALKEFPTAVCHIIAGIADKKVIDDLAHNDLKILILGYKKIRRGKDLYDKQNSAIDYLIKYMYDILPTMIKEGWFNTVSFDNLAIEQLEPRRLMSEKDYNEFFMGDDGNYTFYVDMVKEEFAISSTSMERYKLLDDVKDMFDKVREASKYRKEAVR